MGDKKKKIAVIGGGAAGMMAAITAAEAGADVTLLEAGERVGKKLLATGNGKCNLSNMNLSEKDYYGSDSCWIRAALQKFGTEETLCFFQRLGLMIKNKNGYLYPLGEQASLVQDVLRYALEERGVKVRNFCKVHRLIPEKSGVIGVCGDSLQEIYDSVVLACGGKAAPGTGSDGSGYLLAQDLGHRIVSVVPGLVQLRCRENCFKAVAGVRSEGKVVLFRNGKIAAEEQGEIQFTDYGISGIPVFQLSRKVNYILSEQKEAILELHLLPEESFASFEQLSRDRESLKKGRTVEQYFTGMLNKKLMLLFIKMAGLNPSAPVEQADRERLRQVISFCRKWRIHVNASNGFNNAQVCAGGVDTGQITETMASRIIPGLFFAGEIMDVDGRCGGYNLQWAWTSGYIAGKGAADFDSDSAVKDQGGRRAGRT